MILHREKKWKEREGERLNFFKRGISQPCHPDINLQRNFVVVRSPCAAKIRVRNIFLFEEMLGSQRRVWKFIYPLHKCMAENMHTKYKEINDTCTQKYLEYFHFNYWDETSFTRLLESCYVIIESLIIYIHRSFQRRKQLFFNKN